MQEFDTLPDNSKIWIYQSPRLLDPKEQEYLESTLLTFVNGWESHGNKVNASFKILHNLFVVIAADESSTMASGCSIDKSVHLMQKVGQDLGLDFFNRTNIAFMLGEEIAIEKLKEFKNGITSGKISGHTKVFNNTITQKLELTNNWKIEAQHSWLSQFFNQQIKA